MNAADSWADAGTPRSSAREGLKSSYGVGIVNLILSINITCRYRHSKFLPSDDSCQHRTWERVQAARENESSGNARENLTRWLRRWRQELYQQEYRNFRSIWCYAEPYGLLLVLNMLVGWQTRMLRSLNKWLGCVPRQKKDVIVRLLVLWILPSQENWYWFRDLFWKFWISKNSQK